MVVSIRHVMGTSGANQEGPFSAVFEKKLCVIGVKGTERSLVQVLFFSSQKVAVLFLWYTDPVPEKARHSPRNFCPAMM